MRLLKDGQLIRETYEVERFLGNGAFAEVYRVKHRFLGRQAMKVFKMAGITQEETEGLLGEAVMLSRLGHPNIVRVFDANTAETPKGRCGFFTMEYVAGGTLEQFWRSHGNKLMPLDTAVEIARQVCRGLGVAHDENPPIIHRDIKPQNILVGYDATGLRAKLSDFGLAKHANPLTLLASVKGTRSFKPPEAFKAQGCDSRAADVWALGSVLYLLLTDRLPYAELGRRGEAGDLRFDRPLVPASRLNIQVDPGLDQILMRALALRPEERYPGAKEFLEHLSNWERQPMQTNAAPRHANTAEDSKNALGLCSFQDSNAARKMTKKAIKLALHAGQLMEAADLLEEALNKAPELREQYEYQLKLWRRGIVM